MQEWTFTIGKDRGCGGGLLAGGPGRRSIGLLRADGGRQNHFIHALVKRRKGTRRWAVHVSMINE